MLRNTRKDHEAYRQSVCVFCHRPGCHRTVSDEAATSIAIHVEFSLKDKSLPCGVCESCRKRLARKEEDICSLDYVELLKDSKFVLGLEVWCQCYICKAGRSKSFPRSRRNAASAPPKLKTCGICFVEIRPGKSHDCKLSNRVDNVRSWLPTDVVEQLPSTVIDEQAGGSSHGDTVSLKRKKGPALSLNLGTVPKKQKMTFEEMDKFQAGLDLSDRGSKKLANGLRVLHNDRKFLPSGYDKYLTEKSNIEGEFLKVSKVTLKRDVKVKTEEEIQATFEEEVIEVAHVEDLPKYFSHINEIRDNKESDEILVKVLGDTGGNFFKVCMSVVNLTRLRSNMEKENGRSSYADGLFPEGSNENGIDKLLVIAISHKTKEDYPLVSSVFKLLDFNLPGCRIVFGGDQKYINICTGIGAHKSTFLCSWCFLSSKDFDSGVTADSRCFGDLRNFCAMYEEAGSVNPAKFFNCIRKPLFPFPDDLPVLMGVPPPQLHFYLRSFNHPWKNMEKRWEEMPGVEKGVATKFAISVNAVSASYHGGDYNGNATHLLLNSLDKLERILPTELNCFLVYFKALKKVVEVTFHVKGPVDDSYIKLIEKFSAAVRACDISVTPTIHGIETEIKKFFDLNGTEFGLGLFTEQAGKSVHHDFEDKVYDSTYRRDPRHPDHGRLLMKCVAKYNSKHVGRKSI